MQSKLRAVVVAGLAAAVFAGCATTFSGCAAKRRSRESQSVSRVYAKTSFVNQTAGPVRVTVVVGERTDTPPGIGSKYVGQPQVIAAGQTYQAIVQEIKPYGVGFLFPDNQILVVRFKVESAGATWEPAHGAWYEVVGSLPEVIRIVGGGDVAPMAESDTGRIELVPREWWPTE
jgi:hypothetical protein